MVEQVCAMKLFVVGLIHSYNVVLPSEYLNLVLVSVKTHLMRNHLKCVSDLIRHLRSAPDKVSLPGDCHQGHLVIVHLHRLVTVSVPEDHIRDP